jgi:hypothetical protein
MLIFLLIWFIHYNYFFLNIIRLAEIIKLGRLNDIILLFVFKSQVFLRSEIKINF